MRAYINRADKIADGQFDDKLDCARVTKVRCRSNHNMTKKEAIKILRSEICEPYTGDYSSELEYMAIRMAIKALEQEPCEDCISRQAVLDLIEHYNSDGLGSVFNSYEQGIKFADAVNKLSPVIPKGVTITGFADKCRECGREKVLDKIMEEIGQVKSIMNEEIINNNRKDLINFVNGLNQSLVIVERYKAESVEGGTSLPEGHGRLIDADKLRAEYTKPHLVGYDEIITDIDRQPTVVEGEEDGRTIKHI